MNNKKILITGASGFIGSHLFEKLLKENNNIKGFDRYNIDNSWGWLNKLKKNNNIDFVLGDIRDYDSVYNALTDCDSVIHLAALIGIPYSYISPMAYIKTNIEGTYNVLEASKKLGISNIVVLSTSEVYGSARYKPMDENHPIIGQSPYSASKIGSDQMAISYFRSFEMPIKIARPFNTFGPRQSKRAIIPTIINQLLSKNDNVQLGNIDSTRDFTYVEDSCDGLIEILKSDNLFGEIVNIGSNNEVSIKETFNKINQILNTNAKIKIDINRKRPNLSEVLNLNCDNTKIIQKTNWRPKYNFEAGLVKTIEWMRDTFDITDSKKYII